MLKITFEVKKEKISERKVRKIFKNMFSRINSKPYGGNILCALRPQDTPKISSHEIFGPIFFSLFSTPFSSSSKQIHAQSQQKSQHLPVSS